jgi:hypothetical protein
MLGFSSSVDKADYIRQTFNGLSAPSAGPTNLLTYDNISLDALPLYADRIMLFPCASVPCLARTRANSCVLHTFMLNLHVIFKIFISTALRQN